ncbi:Inactive rhomboid protein 1 [Trichinella sp. T8]|nr:Inactive rhomboid protein 1 [Trichinella sp. T8]
MDSCCSTDLASKAATVPKLKRLNLGKSLSAPDDQPAYPSAPRPSAAVDSLKRQLSINAANYFGIAPVADSSMQKWTNRRIRHCSRRYGGIRESKLGQFETIDGQISAPSMRVRDPLAIPRLQSAQFSLGRSFSMDSRASKVRVLRRRDSVAKLAWDRFSSLIRVSHPATIVNSDSAMQFCVIRVVFDEDATGVVGQSTPDLIATPDSVPMATIREESELGNRSCFLAEPHDSDKIGSQFDESPLQDEVFFDFVPCTVSATQKLNDTFPLKFAKVSHAVHPLRGKPMFLPLTEEEIDSKPAYISDDIKMVINEEESVPTARKPVVPASFQQRASLLHPLTRTCPKRGFWSGLFSRFVSKKGKRRKFGEGVVGRFLGRSLRRRSELSPQVVQQLDDFDDCRPYFTFWVTTVQILVTLISISTYGIGPVGFWRTHADLVHLGAKYAPCMRRDLNVYSVIEKNRRMENTTGCCIFDDGMGCVQTTEDQCPKLLANWYQWEKYNRSSVEQRSRVVCGQDPRTCTKPASISPFEWPDDISKWPICSEWTDVKEYKHIGCKTTGRPCCIGIQDPDQPDQFSRLIIPLFLHAGIIHCFITVVIQYFLLRDLEKLVGWSRVAVIYMISGVGGYLGSAVFVPYQAEVGPAGSQFGLLAGLVVDVVYSWEMIARPWKALGQLLAFIVFLFILGLLPWIDNYAHAFGFVFGLLLSLALFPYIQFDENGRRKRIIIVASSLTICIGLLGVLVILFYVNPLWSCDNCVYFNCIPFTDHLCDNRESTQAEELEVLRMIYLDELIFDDENYPAKFHIPVEAVTTDQFQCQAVKVECIIWFEYTSKYPEQEAPIFRIDSWSSNVTSAMVDQIQTCLENVVKQNFGTMLIYTLVDTLKARLYDLCEQLRNAQASAESGNKVEVGNCEQKKGTPVTLELFLAWKRSYDEATKKIGSKSVDGQMSTAKLTGRQQFQADTSLAISDVPLLDVNDEPLTVDPNSEDHDITKNYDHDVGEKRIPAKRCSCRDMALPSSPESLQNLPVATATTATPEAVAVSNDNSTPCALLVEVKSKFDAEFRRFSVDSVSAGSFEQFHKLVEQLHKLEEIPFTLCYNDPHGDLLPINNDENYRKALETARPLLRLLIQRKGESLAERYGYGTDSLKKRNRISRFLAGSTTVDRSYDISLPQDFRQVSAIIDVDVVPECHRRVRLCKHGSEKPLGFYIREGTSVRVTSQGLLKMPGIFISRLAAGGIAESTGLLAPNDEVLEVNGIEVAGKTLDQVTDMMIANASNLIITVRPADQRLTLARCAKNRGSAMSRESEARSSSVYASNDSDEEDQEDEVKDLLTSGQNEVIACTRRPMKMLVRCDRQNHHHYIICCNASECERLEIATRFAFPPALARRFGLLLLYFKFLFKPKFSIQSVIPVLNACGVLSIFDNEFDFELLKTLSNWNRSCRWTETIICR